MAQQYTILFQFNLSSLHCYARLQTKLNPHRSRQYANHLAFPSQLVLRFFLDQKALQDITPAGQIINLLLCQSALLQQTRQSGLLLFRILRVPPQLLQRLDIILCVFILQSLNRLAQLARCLLNVLQPATRDILRQDGVQSLDCAGFGVQTTTDETMCAGLLVNERDQRVFATGAVVCFRCGGAPGEELDGWVGCYVLGLRSGFAVVGFRIDLGDDHRGFGGEG